MKTKITLTIVFETFQFWIDKRKCKRFFFSLFLKKFLLYLPLKVGQITVRFPLSPLQGRGENRRRKDRGGGWKRGKGKETGVIERVEIKKTTVLVRGVP